jgi:hypothetical protein
LIERGFITDATPLAGSSAGFIAVTCIASGVPFPIIVGYFKDFMRDLRANGTVSRVQPVMRRVMNEMLPEDIHIRLNARAGDSGCGITQLNIGEPQSALTPLVIRVRSRRAPACCPSATTTRLTFWQRTPLHVQPSRRRPDAAQSACIAPTDPGLVGTAADGSCAVRWAVRGALLATRHHPKRGVGLGPRSGTRAPQCVTSRSTRASTLAFYLRGPRRGQYGAVR